MLIGVESRGSGRAPANGMRKDFPVERRHSATAAVSNPVDACANVWRVDAARGESTLLALWIAIVATRGDVDGLAGRAEFVEREPMKAGFVASPRDRGEWTPVGSIDANRPHGARRVAGWRRREHIFCPAIARCDGVAVSVDLEQPRRPELARLDHRSCVGGVERHTVVIRAILPCRRGTSIRGHSWRIRGARRWIPPLGPKNDVPPQPGRAQLPKPLGRKQHPPACHNGCRDGDLKRKLGLGRRVEMVLFDLRGAGLLERRLAERTLGNAGQIEFGGERIGNVKIPRRHPIGCTLHGILRQPREPHPSTAPVGTSC